MYKIINKKKLVLTAAADALGSVLFGLQRLLRRPGQIRPEEVRDILVIRTAYMGDVVMTLPMLKPLKERYPDARISFLTATAAVDVLKNNPFLDEIITFDPSWFYPGSRDRLIAFIRRMRERTFDLVIEARGDIREILCLAYPLRARYRVGFGFGGGSFLLTHVVPYTGVRHKLEYHLDIARFLGCPVEGVTWGVYLTDEEKNGVQELLDANGIRKPFIAVHPGARHELRRWYTDRYARLYDHVVQELGFPVVILGSPGEKELADAIIKQMVTKPYSLVGKATLRQLAGVLSASTLFICNNSGPMHIAASLKVPTIVLHGPSKTYWDAPYGNPQRIVEKEFPCRRTCDENTCRNQRYHACMKDIEVKDVQDAVAALLRELKKT